MMKELEAANRPGRHHMSPVADLKPEVSSWQEMQTYRTNYDTIHIYIDT